MSRIGKMPISLPDKVEFSIDGQHVTVKGPKGQLEMDVHHDMSVAVEDGEVVVTRPSDLKRHKQLHGLTRALLANMVNGVSEGFRRTLVIEGVGYQAEMRGSDLVLKLGFSHEIVMPPPDGNTSFDVPKESRGRTIHVDGIDKQVVGQVAANIRGWRPPEPYKGKGVRYSDEIIRRKAGKAAK
jgi:large subunit ribosomal protein L6